MTENDDENSFEKDCGGGEVVEDVDEKVVGEAKKNGNRIEKEKDRSIDSKRHRYHDDGDDDDESNGY